MDRRSCMLPDGSRDRPVRLLAACLWIAAAAIAGDPPAIHPGEHLALELTAADAHDGLGAARELSVVPAHDGALTVLIESCDGDVLARAVDGRGVTLAEDDDGGVEGNARLVLQDGVAGRPVRLLAAFKTATTGALSVEVRDGAVPAPEGAALAGERGRVLLARGTRRLQRGDEAGAAGDLTTAGQLLFDLGRFADARDAWTAAAPLYEQHGDALRSAFARGFLACSVCRLGQSATALPLLTAAAESARAVSSVPLEIMVVSDLARACGDLGRRDEARQHLGRALELCRGLGGGPNEVILLVERAQFELDDGRPNVALATLSEAGKLADALPIPSLQVEVLGGRAACSLAIGDPLGASAQLRQALALALTPQRQANLRGQLADAALAAGDVLQASSLYRQVADAAAELGDASLLATATVGLGSTRLALGDVAGARQAFESALETWGAEGPPGNRASALMKLASLEAEAGRVGESRQRVAQLEQLASATGSDGIRSQALVAAGQLAYVQRDFPAALAAAEQRRALWTSSGDALQSALASRDVAQAELRLGRLAEAETMAGQSIDVLRSLQRTRDTLHPLCTLAEAAIKRGDAASAARLLDEALAVQRDVAASSGGSDRAMLGALRSGNIEHTPGQLVHDLAALRVAQAGSDAAARDRAIEQGLLAAGEWKGFELAEGLSLRGEAGGAEHLARLAERENLLTDRDQAQAELARASAPGGAPADKAALAARITDLSEKAAALTALLEAEPPPAAPGAPRSTLAALRAANGNGLYVEYAQSMERLYAYVVSPTRADLLDLGPLQERGAQVERYVAGMSDPSALDDAAGIARDGHALHAALLEPALALAPAPDARLVVVPCAAVAALPFEALVVKAPPAPQNFSEISFEIDRREVDYAPSGPVFLEMQASAARTTPGRALVMGDPVYPPAGGATARGSRDPRSLGFVRLPGTRDEALGLAARLLTAHSGPGASPDELLAPARATEDATLDVAGLRLLLGNAANAGALRGDLRDFALIHCATHGHVDALDPHLTGLALTPAGDDDGFVTLADVATLSLDADLAVLSACETGRGGERRGEGTQSLARAFLHAGARAVVSSLWEVDDRETERTMEVFYAGLADRQLTAGAALREARLAVRRESAAPDAFRGIGRGKLLPGVKPVALPAGRADLAGHPFFWAAFTYSGPSGLKPQFTR